MRATRPSTTLLVLVGVSLIFGITAVRGGRDGNAGLEDVEDPFADIRRVEEYYVFVKKYGLGGDYLNLGLAWHTETMFCPRPKDDMINNALEDFFQDETLVSAASGLFGAASSVDTRFKVVDDHMDMLASHLTGKCWVTGYAGIGPFGISFSDDRPLFFRGWHGEQQLIYVGKKTLGLYDLLWNMMVCGNWKSQYYHLLYHNCNYYTKTLMKALNFDSPTFQVEKLTGGAWIPEQGYYSVDEDVCKGTKCTGRGHKDGKTARSGVCDEGKCWDGSEYLPAKHACASTPTSEAAVGDSDAGNDQTLTAAFGPEQAAPKLQPQENLHPGDQEVPVPDMDDVIVADEDLRLAPIQESKPRTRAPGLKDSPAGPAGDGAPFEPEEDEVHREGSIKTPRRFAVVSQV